MLRVLHDAYTSAVDRELAAAGFGDLTGGRAKVLPFVPADGIAVGRLAALAGVRKQSMAQMVDQLRKDGFLRTQAHPEDARSRLVFLTARGEKARPEAVAAGDRVEQVWAELTSTALVTRLRTDLSRLSEAIAARQADQD
jgi:DNA-binding MarR family transcriptional regulator